MTKNEIRKFVRWLETLSWDQLCDLSAYCIHVAMQKREEQRKAIRRAD
jgi:hypothetical protein